MTDALDELLADIARCERLIADHTADIRAEQSLLASLRSSLRQMAPYPFCHHPEKCIAANRCKAEIVCND
jgi:hypothetical protein